MVLSSKHNSKALDNLNNKLLEMMNDSGRIAFCFLSDFSEFNNPEHTSQFILVEDRSSNRFNDLLTNKQYQLFFITIC